MQKFQREFLAIKELTQNLPTGRLVNAQLLALSLRQLTSKELRRVRLVLPSRQSLLESVRRASRLHRFHHQEELMLQK